MSELSDWQRCVLPSELASARASGKAEGIAEAHATIAELEKRIGELDVELAHANGVAMGMAIALNQTKQALTAERQRREELESVVLMLEHDSGKTNEEINAAASAYVSKYLTPTSHPTQEQTQ